MHTSVFSDFPSFATGSQIHLKRLNNVNSIVLLNNFDSFVSTETINTYIYKMLNLNAIDTRVSIAGQNCLFKRFVLNQKFNEHHSFSIEVDYEELDSLWMENPTKIIKLIGESVTIAMVHRQTKEENLFCGIVTDVAMKGKHGEQNNIVISGHSRTIRLEGKKTMDSFIDKPLELIVKEAAANSGNGVSIEANPVYESSIDYICQYNESAFEFLNRLSYLYGEWFFYDGSTIRFGKPKSIEAVDITYDVDLSDFNLSAKLLPVQFNRYNYMVHLDKEMDSDAPDSLSGIRGYLKVAVDKSDSVYTSKSGLPLAASILSKRDLNDMVDVEKSRTAGQMLVFAGSSNTCRVKIGNIVNVKLPVTFRTTIKDVESFLVVEVNHVIDQNGYYGNTFKGIPSGIENIPMEPVSMPAANPQLATVFSNADDKGRIKVQFQWQKQSNKSTNWIRVQTPDAGNSEAVTKNRGFVSIPEKGDQVMVGFEHGDPNKPYVSGSMFPETKGSGGGADNKSKTIITRSGSTIAFDDNSNAGSITITDPSGNVVVLDGNKNITITAPETITINGKNLIVNMEEDITYNVSRNVISNVSKDVTENITENFTQNVKKRTINAENIVEQVDQDYNANISGTLKTDAKKVEHSAGGDYHIDSGSNVVIKGSDEVKLT